MRNSQSTTRTRKVFATIGLALTAIVIPLTLTPNANAQSACVMMDINFQMGMHGSPTPATQVNDVTMGSNANCFSGAAVTHSTQTAVSPGTVTQVRSAESSINSQVPDGLAGMPGFEGGPAIKVPVSVQMDLYNPALDQNFQPGMP
jgi:hypothetical protein